MQYTIYNLISLILVSMALMGFIVSLTIQEKKKYFIGLALSGLMFLFGVYGWGSVALERIRFERRLAEIRKEHDRSLDTLRDRIKSDQPEDSTGKK